MIGFSNASISNIWRVGLLHAIQNASARHKDKIKQLLITDASDDPAKQVSDTQDLLQRGVDLLIVSPATADALDPVVQQAMDSGVPVVLVDRRVSGDNYVSFVTASDQALGRTMAQKYSRLGTRECFATSSYGTCPGSAHCGQPSRMSWDDHLNFCLFLLSEKLAGDDHVVQDSLT